MEYSEAKLFAAFETEMSDLETDITPIVSELDTYLRILYLQQWGHHVPYEQLRLTSLPGDQLMHMSDTLIEEVGRFWRELPERPYNGDLLTFRLDKGEMAYQVRSDAEDEFTFYDLPQGQVLSGCFRALAMLNYVPERHLINRKDNDNELRLADVANPLGLHMVLDRTVLGGVGEDDYQPSPHQSVYIPVHHTGLKVAQLQDTGEY